MHAKGSGAHGTFTVTHDITRYTKAKIFSQIGKQTPMFARSPPSQASAAPLTPSAYPRFALKFYTEEGNWDVVGNNTPVFSSAPAAVPRPQPRYQADPRTLRSADNNWTSGRLLPKLCIRVTMS